MSDTIRRRSLPDSLRYLADRLDSGTLTECERVGVAVTLHTLADQITKLAAADYDDPLWRDHIKARIRTEGGRWTDQRMWEACTSAGRDVTVHRARLIFQHLAEEQPDLLVKVDGTRWTYDTVATA